MPDNSILTDKIIGNILSNRNITTVHLRVGKSLTIVNNILSLEFYALDTIPYYYTNNDIIFFYLYQILTI